MMSSNSKLELLCCVSTRRLQNDLKMIQFEVEHLHSFNKQSSRLATEMCKISLIADRKLQQLWKEKIPPNEREMYCTMRRDKVTEFIDFLEKVKQFGSNVIKKSVEKVQYISFTEGISLKTVLQRVNESLHETAFNLSCNSYHPQCTLQFLSIYDKIVNNLMPLLSNADASFAYYSLVKQNITFIQGMSQVIDAFMKCPKTYSVSLFFQNLMGEYPITEEQTSCSEFSELIDYLTGKLIHESEYLDHKSDIQPIAVDIPPSQNEHLIKHMTCYIFKLILSPKTVRKIENLPKGISPYKEDSRTDGKTLSFCHEDQPFQEIMKKDQLAEKKPRKRGRKSK